MPRRPPELRGAGGSGQAPRAAAGAASRAAALRAQTTVTEILAMQAGHGTPDRVCGRVPDQTIYAGWTCGNPALVRG